ncbi:MAG: hypothetical protein SWX82_17645 [Cyanobacteriota bacterium]|nr:hypothetical protein [Cyanobacteriota bacterium]
MEYQLEDIIEAKLSSPKIMVIAEERRKKKEGRRKNLALSEF